MSSSNEIEARLDAVQDSVAGSLQKSYHGIAARLDRIPAGKALRIILWLAGGICFCDSIDMNIAGPIIAQFLVSGWSDSFQNATFVSMTAFGYLVGGLVAGVVSDGIGRKKALIVFPTIFTASAIVAAFSPDMLFLTVCRFLMGVGLGATYPCGFGAMSEFSPVEKRGRYQAWVGLIANTGTPVATLLCTFLLPVVGWRAIFLISAGMGVIIILCIIKWLPESPRWLANKGRNDEADARVTFMENQMRELGHVVEDIPDEEIAKMVEEAKNQPKELPYRFLFTKKMLPRTIVAGTIQFVNFVVVYTIIAWTPTIFVQKGLSVQYSTALTTLILIGIPVGVALLSVFVDKFGRKPQLIIGFLGSGILGYLWTLIPIDQVILIVLVGFFVAAWTYYWSLICSSVYLPEPFPTQIRVRGAGMGNAIGRIGAIISPYWIAALLSSSFGASGVYIVNALICIAGAIIVGVLAIETTGKSLEEVNVDVLESADKYEKAS